MKAKLNDALRSIWGGARVLSKTIPGPVVVFYVLSLCYMNFFALKEFPLGGTAFLDCSFLLSWIPFLVADILIKVLDIHAAASLAIFGAFCNTLFSVLLWFVSIIPSESNLFRNREIADLLGTHILIIVGSALALIISTCVKCYIVYKMNKKESNLMSVKTVYKEACVSSLIGQLVDNTIFAFFVSYLLHKWTFSTIVVSILLKTVIELFMETVCLSLGYITMTQWKEDGIGEKYLEYINKERERRKKRDQK